MKKNVLILLLLSITHTQLWSMTSPEAPTPEIKTALKHMRITLDKNEAKTDPITHTLRMVFRTMINEMGDPRDWPLSCVKTWAWQTHQLCTQMLNDTVLLNAMPRRFDGKKNHPQKTAAMPHMPELYLAQLLDPLCNGMYARVTGADDTGDHGTIVLNTTSGERNALCARRDAPAVARFIRAARLELGNYRWAISAFTQPKAFLALAKPLVDGQAYREWQSVLWSDSSIKQSSIHVLKRPKDVLIGFLKVFLIMAEELLLRCQEAEDALDQRVVPIQTVIEETKTPNTQERQPISHLDIELAQEQSEPDFDLDIEKLTLATRTNTETKEPVDHALRIIICGLLAKLGRPTTWPIASIKTIAQQSYDICSSTLNNQALLDTIPQSIGRIDKKEVDAIDKLAPRIPLGYLCNVQRFVVEGSDNAANHEISLDEKSITCKIVCAERDIAAVKKFMTALISVINHDSHWVRTAFAEPENFLALTKPLLEGQSYKDWVSTTKFPDRGKVSMNKIDTSKDFTTHTRDFVVGSFKFYLMLSEEMLANCKQAELMSR